MITDKSTIKIETTFSDDRKHRFTFKRVWDKEKPLATVVSTHPAFSDCQVWDTTSALIYNNIQRLGIYGGVQIVNLYSMLTSKLNFRWNSDEDLNAPENDSYIQKAAEESSIVILAWGRAATTNQRIAERAEQVLTLLQDHKEKLHVITDGFRSLIHPLCPSVRSAWYLEPYTPEVVEEPVSLP